MANWETTFTKIIREICDEENINLTSFDDWAYCLRKNGRSGFIYGYQFGLDNAAVSAILKDKSAASEMMRSAGIDHVPHWCVMSPAHPEFCSLDSGWQFLDETLRIYSDLVVKDNQGTGGQLVFRVRTRLELEKACHEIFRTAPALSVSPYVDIKNEYRAIVLDGDIRVAFSKERPYIMGDGVHTVKELLAEKIAHMTTDQLKALFSYEKQPDFLSDSKGADRILAGGEGLVLEWKHNLGQGAAARPVADTDVLTQIKSVVLPAVKMFDLRFASVDVVETEEGYKILEINSGVMMENLASTDEKCYEVAKETYRSAIMRMLD